VSQPFVGEIRMFGGNFAPAGWAFCNGQLVPISENETLFNLIGTTYGGDGQATFALPDLQGRIPVHAGQGVGQNYLLGQTGGTETVTLTVQQIPQHAHQFLATSNAASAASPANGLFAAASVGNNVYFPTNAPPPGLFSTSFMQLAGGSQPHENLMPYLVVSFIISLFGIFPSQT
jgi:microcystin-dependent protein